MQSNTFSMEWPPRSGRTAEFPEIDRVAWFSPDVAEQKLNPAQTAFLARLINCVKHP
jgi:predicted NUDIX family NTP pyrophosphohydrolase